MTVTLPLVINVSENFWLQNEEAIRFHNLKDHNDYNSFPILTTSDNIRINVIYDVGKLIY